MKHTTRRPLLVSLLILLPSVGCGTDWRKTPTLPEEQPNPPEDQRRDISHNVLTFLQRWNDAHDVNDANALHEFYADTVLVGGANLTKDDLLKRKAEVFQGHATDRREILGEVSVEPPSDGLAHASLRLRATGSEPPRDSTVLLSLQDTTSGWRIVSEDETPAATPPPQTKPKRVPVPKGVKAVEGDYDGDGTLESMWLQPPKMSADESECVGACVCRIKFSDPEIPQIVHPDCIGGTPRNLTDLNGGPGDEVGLIPWWFTSCWSGLSVYALKRGQWFRPIRTLITHCDTEDQLNLAGIPLIEIDRKRPGYVITRRTDFDTFKVVTKSERISR